MYQHLRQIIKLHSTHQHAAPQIIILQQGHMSVISRSKNRLFPEHDRHVIYRITVFPIAPYFFIGLRHLFASAVSPLIIKFLHPSATDSHRGMCRHVIMLMSESVIHGYIICVHSCDELM